MTVFALKDQRIPDTLLDYYKYHLEYFVCDINKFDTLQASNNSEELKLSLNITDLVEYNRTASLQIRVCVFRQHMGRTETGSEPVSVAIPLSCTGKPLVASSPSCGNLQVTHGCHAMDSDFVFVQYKRPMDPIWSSMEINAPKTLIAVDTL